MCPKPKQLPNSPPPPEKTATPTQVGDARRQENKDLFGGIPNLRLDTTPGLKQPTGGAGLGIPRISL